MWFVKIKFLNALKKPDSLQITIHINFIPIEYYSLYELIIHLITSL